MWLWSVLFFTTKCILKIGYSFVKSFPILTVGTIPGVGKTLKLERASEVGSSSFYTSSYSFYPCRVSVDTYQDRTTTKRLQQDFLGPWQKFSLWSFLYYMFWVRDYSASQKSVWDKVPYSVIIFHPISVYRRTKTHVQILSSTLMCRKILRG